MDYTRETLTPIKIKFSISNTPEEVKTVLNNKIQQIKRNVSLPGFRQGKAPNNLIMKKFKNEILQEAEEEFIEKGLNEIVEKEKIEPLTTLTINKPEEFIPDQEYKWNFEYEIMPEFEVPQYRGLKGEREKTVVQPENVERAINAMKTLSGKKIPTEAQSPAKEGQIANVDIELLENGASLPEFNLRNYDLHVGNKDLAPEIDAMVMGIPVGNVAEKEIIFSEDFANSRLAGTKKLARVKVNAVFDVDYSKWNEKWQGENGDKELEEFRGLITAAQTQQLDDYNKSVTEAALLTQLLEQVDFPVPDSIKDFEYRRILSDYNSSLRSRGSSLGGLGERLEGVLEKGKEEAETAAKQQVLLMAIAKKENLEVSEDELLTAIEQYSRENGQEFQAAVNSLRESGMLVYLKNKLLADKAMNLVYDNAEITEVEPKGKAVEEEVKGE